MYEHQRLSYADFNVIIYGPHIVHRAAAAIIAYCVIVNMLKSTKTTLLIVNKSARGVYT